MTLSSIRRAATTLLVAAAAWSATACDESLNGVDVIVLDGTPVLLAVTAQDLVVQFGVDVATPIRVRVLDEAGRPIRSAFVHYSVLVGAGFFSADSTITDDQGYTEVTFTPVSPGTVIIEAAVTGPGGTDRARFTFLVLHDPTIAASMTEVGGDNQTGVTGSVLSEPFAVRIVNFDGIPVANHDVTFVLGTSQGTGAGVSSDASGPFVGQVTVQTDASGIARAFLKLGTMAGAHIVTASTVVGLPGNESTQTASFGATARPSLRIATLVPISGQSQTVVIDTLHERGDEDFKGRDPNPMVLQALDEFGNPVPGAPVQWFVSDGGGRLLASQTVTNTNGVTSNQIFDVTEGSNVVVAFASGADPIEFSITAEVYVEPEEDEGDGGGNGGG
ncbi:MAG TPA: Ig-like domain-containing protein [Gemmatimonadota bacterium]|nr:Ig-like domain-containing protein [Gemmatimonadota bacterium]